MNTKAFVALVRAMQLSARAMDAACDSFLEQLNESAQSSTPATPQCPHPPARRTKAGTMGHINRFQCQVCGEVIDPDNLSTPEGGA